MIFSLLGCVWVCHAHLQSVQSHNWSSQIPQQNNLPSQQPYMRCTSHHCTPNKGRLPKWKNRQTQKSHQPNNVSVVRHHIASNRSTNPCRAARLMTATLLGHVDILSCCMKTSICVMVFDIDTLRKSIDSTWYSDVYIPIFKPNPYTWANLPASEWINAVDWCRLYSRQFTYMGAFCIVSCLDYA